MIVLSMGMRPCSGAIMVLLFSKVIGVFSWGMASVLAMAAGTSLTITSLALLVHTFSCSGGETQWKQSAGVMAAGRLVNAGAGWRAYCLSRRWSCGLACRSLWAGCGHGVVD